MAARSKFVVTAFALMACSSLILHEQQYLVIASKSVVGSNSKGPTFGAAGDWGCTSQTEKTVADVVAKRPELVLALGDLSYEETPDCWFDTLSPIKNKTRIAIGNHDDSPSFLRQYLDEFGLEKQYYSFDYQSIHFISMSTEIPYDRTSEQFLFVTRDLANATTNPEIKWIIVFFHKPMYISPSWVYSEEYIEDNDIIELREIYHPLFSRYHVDLVLAGHNHNYERSYPIKYNYENDSEPIITSVNKTIYDNPDGPIFITAGTGGQSLFDFDGQSPFIANQYVGYGFVYFHLSKDSTVLTGTFYSWNVIEDEFSIRKTPKG